MRHRKTRGYGSHTQAIRKKNPKQTESHIERSMVYYLRVIGTGLPEAVREYRFHPVRRWRFDFAYPEYMVAVECDGGQWAPYGGRHARDTDREKLNAAASLGWRVLRFSGEMLTKDPQKCVEVIAQTLGFEKL